MPRGSSSVHSLPLARWHSVCTTGQTVPTAPDIWLPYAGRTLLGMARTQTLVQLTDDLLRLLDEEAGQRGISRSALIREVLEEHLASRHAVEISRRIVEGYERIPAARPDTWGDLGRMTDQSTVDLLQRLDEEERRGGHGPW